MKYSELEKIIKKTTNCYFHHNSNHPVWYNPDTDTYFDMSHHGSEEVRPGTLQKILKLSGAKR
ncbi:MAG: type II toxin-antitoxin system HicA family toxin [Dysgonamonadaceae bacterium]|nr:type II toxin-antitoxin system HicA family toxin [Dysgonamonadaceae bacterium]